MEQSLGKQVSSIFYQYDTDVIFKELVKQHTPTDTVRHGPDLEVPALDYQETNALHYAAGYIIRALNVSLRGRVLSRQS